MAKICVKHNDEASMMVCRTCQAAREQAVEALAEILENQPQGNRIYPYGYRKGLEALTVLGISHATD